VDTLFDFSRLAVGVTVTPIPNTPDTPAPAPAAPEPSAPSSSTTSAGASAETRQEGGSSPNPPRAESTSRRADDPGPVFSPSEAAMLADDDERGQILASITDAKGQLERQPPDGTWAAIVKDVCGPQGLLKADVVALTELR